MMLNHYQVVHSAGPHDNTMSFLSSLQSVYVAFGNQSSNSSVQECDSAIDHYLFYNWMLLPSGLCTVFLAFFIKRKNKLLDILGGRPGLLYPLNIFTLENRLTLAAAFGSISFILADIVLDAKYAIPFSGEIWLRIFVILGSVMIYGVVYFPLFAGLATRSLVGYSVSCVYAWMFAVIDIYQTFECELDAVTRILLIVRNLPKLVASLFLAISLSYMVLKEVKKLVHKDVQVMADVIDDEKAFQQIRESHFGRHVRALFLPPPPPPKPKEGCFGKIQNIVGPFVHKWIYHRQPNFRYPARVVAVYTACIIIIYKVTAEILIIFVPLIEIYQWEAGIILEELGLELEPGEDEWVTALRSYMLFDNSVLFGILGRTLDDNPFPIILQVSTIRYAGYQIAYTAWAYIIQWFVFFLLSFAVATVITLLAYGYADIIVNLIRQFWPIPVNIIVMLLFQMLVTKFLFTQENGDIFGINNRRGFFIFAYFLFFYNIFLGLISCLLRILKGIGVGALLLGRLDQSTLSRKWQWFDPGFDAYLGFIHTENYQMNPVVTVFIDILRLNSSKPSQRHKALDNGGTDIGQELENVEKQELRTINDVTSKRAKFNWHLAYSLHNNPQLRAKRKHFLDQLKARMEETYARIENEKKALKESMKAHKVNVICTVDVEGKEEMV